ncbi:MAG: hypothetical protein LBU22_00155 [Dysgonamonadaceae bacterium]|nr:hypothetical protein [Dysgonamonadaceae bacterium]
MQQLNLREHDRLFLDTIQNIRKEHHKTVSFEEEYRQFLIDNGIEIDERYFLQD